MSWDFCTEKIRTARKIYECNASLWIQHLMDFDELSFSEKKIFAKAKRENFRILPGTKYLQTSGMYEGEFDTCRSRLDMQEIFENHNLYEFTL